jgi:hypothetical protein
MSRSLAWLVSLVVVGFVVACGGSSKSSTDQITSFAFLAADNPNLSNDVAASITGTTITATVPYGTDVGALVATFTSNGDDVTVGGTTQVSGTTPNDFSNAVTYEVTAGNGAKQDYAVMVMGASSTAKEITSYAFLAADNPSLTADVTATITGTNISATVPYGTDVTKLVATFGVTGAMIAVNGTPQVSGTTANDFTAPVIYTVTAADQSVKNYAVTISVATSTAKELTSYSFLAADNPGLAADVDATINGTAITATVPFGTKLTALVATFETTGKSVAVGATAQVSGVTPNNFTAPVSYVVTAADGSTKTYTVTVTVAMNTAKTITSFQFLTVHNAGLTANVTATITGTNIAATVPFGTDVTKLVATFATTGASVAVGAVTQVSGTTANNFTSPVAYVVTAADGTMQTYTVTVTVAASPAKDITSFEFLSADNADLPADVIATINGTTIAATVPFGTDVTKLVASFATTGASVAVGAVTQVSGVTANNFTSAVAYVVKAADASTKTYTVTVTIAPSPADDITSYQFLTVDNAGLAANVDATIDGTAITATVPYGTDVTALVATFATTGKSVTVGGVVQTSGATANNFTTQVIYTVTAADASTKSYTVTLAIAASPAKAITSFQFLTVDNSGLTANVTATITGTAIAATVPYGTAVTGLVATFATTGASVAVGTVAQVSGTTANNFTMPVAYVVTAADGTTQTYTVTVTIAASPAKDITSFQFLSSDNSALMADVTATITGTSIAATVPMGTVVTDLIATFATTGKSVAVGAAVQTSGVTANDFTMPVSYVVTAADGTMQTYTVTVTAM